MSWTAHPGTTSSNLNAGTSSPCPCATDLQHLSSLLPPPAPAPSPGTTAVPAPVDFDFTLLTTLTQPLDDLVKSIATCKNHHRHRHHHHQVPTPNSNPNPNGTTITPTIVSLSDTILALCHAACTTYNLLLDTKHSDESSANSPSASGSAATATDPPTAPSPYRCLKSPMALGSLALQDEEEALLARQILYAVLTALSAVLRDLYIRDREAGMQPGLSLLLLHHGENGTGNGNGNGNGTLYGREGDGAANRCLSRVLALLGKVVPE